MEILGADVNIIAVIISSVLAFILGALWYTPVLFGNMWMKLVGIKPEDQNKEGSKAFAIAMVIGFLIVTLMLFGFAVIRSWLLPQVAVVLQNDSAIVISVFIAFIVSLFTLLPSNWLNDNYEGKSIKLTALNVGYQFLTLVIGAVVLSVM